MAHQKNEARTRTSEPHKANLPCQGVTHRTAATITDQDDDDIAVEGFKLLLPKGQWFDARFDGHATALVFGKTPKVFWEFTIIEPGEWFEARVFSAYRARKIFPPYGKQGKFSLSANGEMYQTIVRLLDIKVRPDRVTLRPLRHMLFRIHTRTVLTNYKREPLPEHARYSIIDSIQVQQ